MSNIKAKLTKINTSNLKTTMCSRFHNNIIMITESTITLFVVVPFITERFCMTLSIH